MWFLLLCPILAWSQTDIDLSAIQDLESILPDHDIRQDAYRNIEFERKNRGFRPPERHVPFSEITQGPWVTGHLKAGTTIYRLSDNKPVKISKEIYLKMYSIRDELDYVYLLNNDKTCTFRVRGDEANSIQEVQFLYEPPRKYYPVDKSIARSEYDKKLKVVPEAAFYAGIVQGNYIRDLFNDKNARSGNTNQYGLHLFTQWNLPVKVGAAIHFERSSYKLTSGGNAFYQALSFGPQFRTKDFDLFETIWRVTTQIRVSPLARVHSDTINGNIDFKFNSTDLMTTIEHPWDNGLGQFVIGAFHQAQWLNIKDQPKNVSVSSSNMINQSFGLFLSQVFQ